MPQARRGFPRTTADPLLPPRREEILLPPAEMKGFPYLMIWHPRLDTDAAHVWLRSSVRAAGKALSST